MDKNLLYINKYIEMEETFFFTHNLIKKLNSVKDLKTFSNILGTALLEFTQARSFFLVIFNQDSQKIELEKSIFLKNTLKDINLIKKFKKEYENGSFNLKNIISFIKSLNKENIIALPITNDDNLIAFMILIHKNKKFNDEKIKYIKIIVEQFALILGNISLYNELKKTANINLEFLVSISHEFKTPLNSIIGFSEILQEQTDDKNTFNKLKNIKYSSTHLLSIIQDVLDIAKSDNKKLEINKNIFNPQKVILEILNTLELQIKAKNINLTYTLLDMELNADERRFKQLLYNLFSNAIKYNKPNGSINIIIYKENKNFVLEISDTGEGIAEKDQKKIFNFFTQTSPNYLNRETGSGVGLALCKRIVDAHKGKIGFKSVLNKGSTFYFKLPNN